MGKFGDIEGWVDSARDILNTDIFKTIFGENAPAIGLEWVAVLFMVIVFFYLIIKVMSESPLIEHHTGGGKI